jgi:hypothetical protein
MKPYVHTYIDKPNLVKIAQCMITILSDFFPIFGEKKWRFFLKRNVMINFIG